MLNKIENISPNPSYKEKSNLSGNTKEVNPVIHLNINAADSFSFSSAVKYLNLLKWKLKQFKQSSNGMVEVEFSIDEFSFHTKLFGPDFFSQFVEYKIQNEHALRNNNLKYEITVKFEFYKAVLLKPIEIAELDYLKILFKRITENENLSSSSAVDLMNISLVLDGINGELIKELSDIHKKLLVFLEKVTSNPQIPASNGSAFTVDADLLQINILGIEVGTN